MKKLLLILLCLPMIGFGQSNDYELEFNSSMQDYVEMPNLSVLIANNTNISMSCWINPQINTAHGGIIGFRNNTDADFYLLHLQGTNNIEARFRNSTGVSYDVIATNALDYNQWQHLAFTYDGSYIRLYKNGVIFDSTAANGTITSANESFKLGALDWQGTGFYMNGRLDEARLWGATISSSEINNWMCLELNSAHPNFNNLLGCWRLNDGTGTIATDFTLNGNNGTLMNSPMWHFNTNCISQKTYVPDNAFESYLEINGMGDGVPYNDSVFTSAIDTLTYLDVSGGAGSATGIFDLTGIEDFVSLITLYCHSNLITSLDVSNNTMLFEFDCAINPLTSLIFGNNTNLTYLDCGYTNLDTLIFPNSPNLTSWSCNNSNLSYIGGGPFGPIYGAINMSNNLFTKMPKSISDWKASSGLDAINCSNNLFDSITLPFNNFSSNIFICDNNPNLIFLDLRHDTVFQSPWVGNATSDLSLLNTPNLSCINIDDTAWANTNWTVANGNIDIQHYFSVDCSETTTSSIQEYNAKKKLLKVIDLLGREVRGVTNIIFYMYNDGTVSKRVIVQ